MLERIDPVTVVFLRPAGEEDKGQLAETRGLPHPAAHFEAVGSGQHDVANHGLRRGCRRSLDGLLTAPGRIDREPLQAKVDLQQTQDHGVVVNQQHARDFGDHERRILALLR